MIRIIPAIDIIQGEVVRLTQGRFEHKKIYSKNPAHIAKMYEKQGIKYLHLVDLEGAKSGKIKNYRTIEHIATTTDLHIDFGGGIRSQHDLQLALDSGAQQVTLGSIAVKNKTCVYDWIDMFGADKFILGADVIDKKIAVSAWQEKSELALYDFIETYKQCGVSSIICTDVNRDGLLSGPSFALYAEIKQKFPDMFLIASGGVSKIEDIEKLNNDGIDGVIIGKALYENKIHLNDLKLYLC
jgi:phosphoribosylformimino-5-aminoimidazole carboxamide ribotide isomerase